MKRLREHAYVFLMDLAYWVAPQPVREIHNEVASLGMKAYNAALDARIYRKNPR